MGDNEIKKLAVLLGHWIQHNDAHLKDYRKWAEIADREGLKEVAHHLTSAVELLLQSGEKFVAAQKGMPVEHVHSPVHDHGHGHEQDPHDHDFTKEYEIINHVVDGVKGGSVNLQIEKCKGCGNLSTCTIPYADALHHAFVTAKMPCAVICKAVEGKRVLQMTYQGDVFMQVDPVTKQAIQKCHDDTCNVALYNRVFDVDP